MRIIALSSLSWNYVQSHVYVWDEILKDLLVLLLS